MVFLAGLLSLGAVAAYWASRQEAEKHGDTVVARRWETSVFYRDDEFIGWVTSGAPSLDGYARVLAPYDFALLACLGGAFAAASVAAAEYLRFPQDGRWVLALAPLAFAAADFAENRVLLRLIAARRATPTEILGLKKATLAKFVALGAAASQTLVLLLWLFVA
ncbi:hypothetical protein ACNHKD_16895 [Methylocystis sp. JAN1]|uniref:hypothetical protein n=1 Tax=Methylocystis sp. JAN1 TaxID=3397211 RepID=UPI003FA1DFD7